MESQTASIAMLSAATIAELSASRDHLDQAYLADETTTILTLAQSVRLTPQQRESIVKNATRLIEKIRVTPRNGLDALLQEYSLSNEEGVALMCLAEALLRIPDDSTTDLLIRDKLSGAQWQKHLGQSTSFFVNASSWGLLLTGRLIQLDRNTLDNPLQFIMRWISRSGEPLVRAAIKSAMRILGRQFVMGETIEQAWQRSQTDEYGKALFSFDMLGEAAITQADVERYMSAYRNAIMSIGRYNHSEDIRYSHGISIKLSALHPRFEALQAQRVHVELIPRLHELLALASSYNLQVTIDAEESARLALTLDIFTAVFKDKKYTGWPGLGLAVQAYQKRAAYQIEYLQQLAMTEQRIIPVRLVKGAYWDTEIKLAQEQALQSYPVFTKKCHTDVSYLACVKLLSQYQDYLYPQFATHNAYTLAAIQEIMRDAANYEFQRLHGMGQALYQHFTGAQPCRVYAPVGGHADLLPYLVRRLLENGANTSFVNRITDQSVPIQKLLQDPVEQCLQSQGKTNSRIKLPAEILMPERMAAKGLNIDDFSVTTILSNELNNVKTRNWDSSTLLPDNLSGELTTIYNPADRHDQVGRYQSATADDLQHALQILDDYKSIWSATDIKQRTHYLLRAADLIEATYTELTSLLMREAGRCLQDAIAELREAVDFCRYYAVQARKTLRPQTLSAVAGEQNELRLHPRGIVACISPWNFPLSIFTGQIAAALVTGNCVIAKPASATPLIAARLVNLMYAAGIPQAALQLTPCRAQLFNQHVIGSAKIDAVVFTGSTDTAHAIQQQLNKTHKRLIPLIAETGGLNAMIADSSTLPEQLVRDIIKSSFNSAGQRCSALRILYLQTDIADKVLALLFGCMDALRIGQPLQFNTDIGPVINQAAQQHLLAYIQQFSQHAGLAHQLPLNDACKHGYFVAPCVIELQHSSQLQQEVFGPILHVLRFQPNKLDDVISTINQSGYGLTLGIHSRIQATIDHITQRAHVGNIYVNRTITGAVVGSQPFGGEGLSGTGPKAGGPNYLHAFCTERVLTQNLTAIGGNSRLLTLDNDD